MIARLLATTSRVALFAIVVAVSLPAQQATQDVPVRDLQGHRIITPEDLIRGRRLAIGWHLGDVVISPDGSRVAYVAFEAHDPVKPKDPVDTKIWVVPTDGSAPARVFAACPRSNCHPRWSPDSQFLAYVSDGVNSSALRNKAAGTEDGGTESDIKKQIYLLRIDSGRVERLTNVSGDVLDCKWSPDSKTIAFTMRDPPSSEEERRRKNNDDAIHVDHDYEYAHLWEVSVSERKSEQITAQSFEVVDFVWSPDQKEFAAVVCPTPRKDDVFWGASLVVIQRNNGKIIRTLSTAVDTFGMGIRWSPDGKKIVFPEYSPQKIADRFAVVPAEGGPVTHLLDDYRGSARIVEWEPDSKHLVAEIMEYTRQTFQRVEISTGALQKLGAETAVPDADFSLTADGRMIAYLYGAANNPGDVYMLSFGGLPRRLTNLHPEVASWRLGNVRGIKWKSSKDGKILSGVLVAPAAFRSGQRYPTVVQVHGGPEWAWWEGWLGSWHEWAQLLASNGYVVFLPNPRGSIGQGWQYEEANHDDWGGGDFQDITDGLDVLINQKIADPNRLGIGGWSYGGFMTSWAITQGNRFKAAVVGAGYTNLLSFNGTTDITPSFLRAYLSDIPFRRMDAYDRHSPIRFLQNCKTPTLILHGEKDERVPIGQAWELYNGLKMLHVPAELVIYPREHHEIVEPAHQVNLLKAVLAWYDKYLKQ